MVTIDKMCLFRVLIKLQFSMQVKLFKKKIIWFPYITENTILFQVVYFWSIYKYVTIHVKGSTRTKSVNKYILFNLDISNLKKKYQHHSGNIVRVTKCFFSWKGHKLI